MVVLARIPFPGPPLDHDAEDPKIFSAIYVTPIVGCLQGRPSNTIAMFISSLSLSILTVPGLNLYDSSALTRRDRTFKNIYVLNILEIDSVCFQLDRGTPSGLATQHIQQPYFKE